MTQLPPKLAATNAMGAHVAQWLNTLRDCVAERTLENGPNALTSRTTRGVQHVPRARGGDGGDNTSTTVVPVYG